MLKEEKRVEVLEVPIDQIGFFDVLKKIERFVGSGGPHQIATVNPEFIIHSTENEDFKKALQESSLNTADGTGIVWASKFIRIKNKESGIENKLIKFISKVFWLKITLLAVLFDRKWLSSEIPERVTGIDLMWELANRAQERGWRVFLLGGAEGVADEVAEKLKTLYPRINIIGVSAPRVNDDGIPEEDGVLEKVAATKPDILFVAFGSPKQEIFIHNNLKKLGAKVVIGVGGSFDFIIGKAKRAPKLFQKLGIEWLWRLFQQPKRVNRIWNAFPRFVWKVFRSK